MTLKLRGKILCLVLLPIIVVGLGTYLVVSSKVRTVIKEQVEKDLAATAVSIRDSCYLGDGELEDLFEVDENGDFWNHEQINLTQDMAVFDEIKEVADMEMTIFFGDTRYSTSVTEADGKQTLGTKANDVVIEHVLKKGENYFAENIDVAGTKYFGYYIPLYDSTSSDPVGMIFAGMKQQHLEGEIFSILNAMMGIVLAIAIVCMIIAVIFVNLVTKRIKRSVQIVQEVSQGNLAIDTLGDIGLNVNKLPKDEVGDMVRSIVILKDELIDTMKHIVTKSHELTEAAQLLNSEAEETRTTAEQVDRAVSEIAQGATSQAEETEHASENVIEIGNMVQNTSAEVEHMTENVTTMNQKGEQAKKTLKELEQINSRTKDAIDVIYEQTNTTNESALKIREATALITSIAEETNLLSLNASIEAARAGEQGRGFAVVASQIQKLAEQSNESAQSIEQIINELITDSQKAVATMDDVKQIMQEQNEKVNATGKIFEDVMDGIAESLKGVEAIAEHTEHMDQARIGVVDTVQSLTAIAEENAASTEETSASMAEVNSIVATISSDAENLNKIAEELKEAVQFFKL